MTVRNHTFKFVLVAATLSSASACDTDGSDAELGFSELEELDVSFRDNCHPMLQNCNVRNNFYLGIGEYALDNLPLVQGSNPYTEITRIVAYKCLSSRKGLMFGTFELMAPNLTVDDHGTFGPAVFTDVSDPLRTCEVSGQVWEGTEWFISTVTESNVAIDAKLGIADMQIKPGDSTLYQWQSDLEYVYGGAMQGWIQTCEEDPDPTLDFHAVVYPSLSVDEQSGVFSEDPDTAYLGCTAGLVAKSGYTWGYRPEGNDVHQVIANAGMAKYCGPSHDSFTETGTEIKIWNKTGSGPHQSPLGPLQNLFWSAEAAWDSSMTAMCIGQTRLPVFQPAVGDDFECSDFDIPPCTQQILDDPAVMFITYSQN